MAKAVFLDRDGTINIDTGYLSHPEELELFPGAAEGLRLLQDAGFFLIVVTNQSGIARGYLNEKTLSLIHEKMDELLKPHGVSILEYLYCPEHPDSNPIRRKPHPTMLLEAAKRHDLLLGESYMIGDRLTDLQAGIAAGCRGQIMVQTGLGQKERPTVNSEASFFASDLLNAAQWICSREV
ncbi:MAG: hypothetical protein CL678_17795 [Bdellovibrionaceae bacterium]|nr:hypothetical protein [Pseudobdellovibrionaceae bacterium]|tara:strand:+ start:346 stop:888 length:543 start_codon:yes stop_codon:yes gene_type:complete